MKILVVGAGAIGGYFGGRLLEKGEDVTFLVREGRKTQIEQNGLHIESVHGNIILEPKLILREEVNETYDLILLSTKAYHLQAVIKDIRPYVTEETMILPLLNGISHMDTLVNEFGDMHVLGGLCFIETTLAANGNVVQTSPIHNLVFGERSGEKTERIQKVKEAFSHTKANFIYSDQIMKEMWHKYLFISLLSGATTLMRAPIGPIREVESGYMALTEVATEVVTVMEKNGAPVGQELIEAQLTRINEMGYEMKSSMQRDMEKGMPTEADHFFLYLLKHAKRHQIKTPYLQLIYANLQVYEKMLQN
ncbi:ketopantoate reductase family protein [Robertmurraya kyonggiensis]|uniref:2-dehydropantoate 2-reductase n=1 Tax=Robertmurraya kyonggiensis TaxID=1037680 RepID=A0A4U1DD94_9BACI|nr:ketopantoate reductase family protein [Robertmurraya kyonggiensis]TKC19557.1 ketopantoate reductase family protein [Robertmurraya kyonggiensis]